MVLTPVAPVSSEEPSAHPGPPFRALIVGLVAAVLIAGGTWLFVRNKASGDPGGKVLSQLVPAASALPGYGTPSLPWISAPSMSGPYLIKSEPRQDSCDGMAGTQGWSQVVVQAGFDWTGTPDGLFSSVGEHLYALGWNRVSIRDPTDSEAIWSKRLTNGSTAEANLSPEGEHYWEFVALAPPVGKAASGC
jgi:hypothetical protein